MSTYETINYNLRPSKHIERKMMIEVFRNLAVFGPVREYRYIGFGSIYFSDFYLIHKYLGLTDMLSIEHDEDNKERFEFNLPFKCIDLEFGNSVKVLPTLTWDKKTIIWLDYDGTLNKDVIADIKFVCTHIPEGSMFIVTVSAITSNRETEDEDNTLSNTALEALKKRVGANNVPADITDKDLRKWGTADVYRRIINNQIQEALSTRNGVLNPDNKIVYDQLFNFHYQDGAKMATIGGVFYKEGQKNLIDLDQLKLNFPFIRTEEEAYLIKAPCLTYREIRYLDSLLPADILGVKDKIKIPTEDLQHYSQTYRYFPTFADTEL